VDTSTLRWILIIVGIVIVGSIFLFGNPEKKRKPRASRKEPGEGPQRLEPTLEGGDTEIEGQGELDIEPAEPVFSGTQHEPAYSAAPISAPPDPAVPQPDKITTLFLLARDNHTITGAELLQATVNTGMEFGDMNIFHRIPEGAERPVFSLANAAKPGHFERDEWNTFETSGVALFLTLPGPLNALDAWDSMLATARRMSEILQADLLDDERDPFTRQREAQVREEMREYERRLS